MHIAYAPVSTKFLNSPYMCKFINFPRISFNLRFFAQFMFFSITYFHHDPFMHHALHALDAPADEYGGETVYSRKIPAPELLTRPKRCTRGA